MYETFIKWIGSKTCKVAGELHEVLDAGTTCLSGQSLNMGFVVLGIMALTLTVLIINARRRQRRDDYLQ
jgi:hypothetical protein